MRKSKGYQTRYSQQDKANALAMVDANGGNVSAASRQAGVPRVTLSSWFHGRGDLTEETQVMREQAKATLADRLEELAHKLVSKIPDLEGNIQQAAIALGIAVEKMQLLRGQPTDRQEMNLDDKERVDRAAAILATAEARQRRRATEGGTGTD